jgi:hypothetical protein
VNPLEPSPNVWRLLRVAAVVALVAWLLAGLILDGALGWVEVPGLFGIGGGE